MYTPIDVSLSLLFIKNKRKAEIDEDSHDFCFYPIVLSCYRYMKKELTCIVLFGALLDNVMTYLNPFAEEMILHRC